MSVPKVFISYAHDTEQFADKILNFSNTLRENIIDANIDQYEECPAEGWPRWMENQIDNADYVLVVCTDLYYNRVKNYKSGEGKGVNWELNIIYQFLYESCCNNTKFIPIIFDDYKTNNILKPLQSSTYYFVDREKEFHKLCNRLKGIKNVVKPPLGKGSSTDKNIDEIIRPKERKNLFVTSMIDMDSWNKAKWCGVAYMFDPKNEEPPLMALMFRNKEYASKIFENWKKHSWENVFTDIKISVIEKTNIGEKDGYFVHITTNMDESIKRAEKQGMKLDETLFFMVSRYQYMDIDMFNNNLAVFKKQLENKKEYFISPAILEEGKKNTFNNIEFGMNLRIKMNDIKFIKFEELSENDIEHSVVQCSNKEFK